MRSAAMPNRGSSARLRELQPPPRIMKTTTTFLAVAALIAGLTGCQNCQPCPSGSPALTADAQSKAQVDLAAIGSAISHYQRNNGGYSPSDLGHLVMKDQNGKRYFGEAELPLDVYGRAYAYSQDDQGQAWELCFLGKDGVRGGEGADADICTAQVESGS